MRRITAALKARRQSTDVARAVSFDDIGPGGQRCASPGSSSDPSPRYDIQSVASSHNELSATPYVGESTDGCLSAMLLTRDPSVQSDVPARDPSLRSAAVAAGLVYRRANSTSLAPQDMPSRARAASSASASSSCASAHCTHCAMVRHGYELDTGQCITCVSDTSLSSSLASTPDSGGNGLTLHTLRTSGQAARSMRRRASFGSSTQRVIPNMV